MFTAIWSCYAAFFSLGTFVSLWAVELPRIKAALHLSPLEIAGAGFALGGSAVVGMSLLPPLLHRWGSGKLQRWCWLGMVCAIPWPFMAESMWGLYLYCVGVGVFSGSLDVAMNAQSLEVEQQAQTTILSKLHGAFSLAGLLGAVFGYLLLRWEVTPEQHAWLFTVICAVLWWSGKAYAPDRASAAPTRPGSIGITHNLILVVVLAVSMALSLTVEGSVETWSGIYLNTVHGWEYSNSALGYGTFACAMVIGRWSGDAMRERFDTYRLLSLSCFLTALGYAMVLSSLSATIMLLGYLVLGFGLSLQVPLFFVIVDRSPEVDTATAVARISAVGYGGLLLGPVLVGALASYLALWGALCVVATLPVLQWILLRLLPR